MSKRFSFKKTKSFVIGSFLVATLVGGGLVASNLLKVYRKRQALFSASGVNDPVIQSKCRALFDANWYRKTYPNVHATDLFQHYMTQGWKEGKSPSASFDASFYRAVYQTRVPGMRKFNIPGDPNPLVHYVQTGDAYNAITHPKEILWPVPLAKPKYKVALCSMFRDEARFLKEFIEYHLMLGVEHFYLLNHRSQDNYADVLQPYINKGLVTLYHEQREEEGKAWGNLQAGFYNRVIQETAPHTEWLIITDSDSYVVPRLHNSIPALLDSYPDAGQVSLGILPFGTAGKDGIGPHKLMTEHMTLSQKEGLDWHVRSIVRPRYQSVFLVHMHL